MRLIDAPSPNLDARLQPPDMIILHYTGMPTGAEALARLRDPAAQVSAHYLIEEDGQAFLLVPEERRAWHAGVSFWKGERNLNGVSIGIERRRLFTCPPVPAQQIPIRSRPLSGTLSRHFVMRCSLGRM